VEAAGIEPASSLSEVVTVKEVSELEIGLAADRQRKDCANCQLLASSGRDDYEESDSSFAQIKAAWPHLPPHIREAISTLLHASLATDNSL